MLTSDFNKAIQHSKRVLKTMMSPYQILGYEFLKNNLNLLPYNMMTIVYNHSSRTTSFGFSSIPGPPDGFLFHGMKSRGMYAMFPAVGEQLCNLLAVSMDDRIKVSFQLDINYIEDPKLFIEFFNNRMIDFIISG